jgi:hypothetical protein
VAKRNEAMGEIIRGEPNRDAISCYHTDVMTSHFPTEFGKDLHVVIREFDGVQISSADVNNGSFYLE